MSVVICAAWQAIASKHGLRTSARGQCVKRMSTRGWLQYASKHGSRGVQHYQREREALPESWRDRPGRMWGHGGDWSTRQCPQRFEFGRQAFWAYRERIKKLCVDDADRAPRTPQGDKWREQARGMLTTEDKGLWQVLPIAVWQPDEATMPIVRELRADYERRLADAGGDLDAVADWYVGPYESDSVRQKGARMEWTVDMRQAMRWQATEGRQDQI